MNGFAEVIDSIQKFDYDELIELNELTNKYIIEIKRKQIEMAHNESIDELESGELKFSANFNELESILDSL